MNLSVFSFESREVRTIAIDGAPWFVAEDIATALEYRNAPDMTRNLDDDEKGTQIVRTLGGDQEMTVINESGLYSAILKSRKPEAKRFKKWVTSEVLPSIRKTGSYSAAPAAGKVAQDLEALEVLARFLNVAPSGKITMARAYLTHAAPSLLPALPSYAIDAPPSVLVSGNGSSMVTASATELLKRHNVPIPPAKFNELLAKHNVLAAAHRPTKDGLLKHFWAVTAQGERYGKNITSAHNSRETQPHWFVDCFGDLLEVVGVSA